MENSGKNKTKKEWGRSMVEMIGVLAVIGLLSIGGLYGYRRSINKHEANVITDELQKRAVSLATQLTTDHPLNLGEFDEKIQGKYQVSVASGVKGKRFVLTVSDIPADVMKQLLVDKFGGLSYWAVGIGSYGGVAQTDGSKLLATGGHMLVKSAWAALGETNTVWFEFLDTLKSTPEKPTDDIKKLGTEYTRCEYTE